MIRITTQTDSGRKFSGDWFKNDKNTFAALTSMAEAMDKKYPQLKHTIEVQTAKPQP